MPPAVAAERAVEAGVVVAGSGAMSAAGASTSEVPAPGVTGDAVAGSRRHVRGSGASTLRTSPPPG